jgi:hypothetical protein
MEKELKHYELQCDAHDAVTISRSQLLPENYQRCTDEESFCDWIASATSGEAIEYHCGYLICDRTGSNGIYGAKEQQRISALARRAWIAAEVGLLHLYSERLGECRYRYMAVRSNTTLGMMQ